MGVGGTLIVGLAILIGIVGAAIQIYPGLMIVVGAIAVWAVVEATGASWAVLAIALVLAALATLAKFLVPGRQLTRAGVPASTLWWGAAAGVVGFFVIPVVGLFIGFVLGVYVAELVRLGGHERAWPATVVAMRAVGWSILIELAPALLAGAAWLIAVIAF